MSVERLAWLTPSTHSGPVRAYRNLHKASETGGPVYSIQDARTRRVIAHADAVTLEGVTFVVSEAGRERVRREQRKNVHALVVGTPCEARIDLPGVLRYDPYVYDAFTDPSTGLAVTHARLVTLDAHGIHYLPL